MKRQHITTLMLLGSSVFVATVVLTAQSQDRFTLKSANGIAFSEFRGYDAWQLVATSQPDDASGCGTSKVGCMKAILGNPTMIKAYREGIPANGNAVPDGAALAKIEWLQDRDEKPVREQRLYQLIRQPGPIVDRTFEIEFIDAGVEAFAFTFG